MRIQLGPVVSAVVREMEPVGVRESLQHQVLVGISTHSQGDQVRELWMQYVDVRDTALGVESEHCQ